MRMITKDCGDYDIDGDDDGLKDFEDYGENCAVWVGRVTGWMEVSFLRTGSQ